MRARHNIIGSEVGRTRPPVYMRTVAVHAGRRRRVRRRFGMIGLLALLILLGALLAVAS